MRAKVDMINIYKQLIIAFIFLVVGVAKAQVPVSSAFNDIGWNPVNSTIARSYEDGTIQVFDSAGTVVFSPSNDLTPATKVAWSTDGRYLAVGASNRVRVWDVAMNNSVHILDLPASPISGTFLSDFGTLEEVVIALEWSLTDKLVSLSNSGVLRTWDINGNPEVDTRMIQSADVSWNVDSTALISTSGVGIVYINSNTGVIEAWAVDSFSNLASAIDWSKTGERIAIGTGQGDIIVLDGENRSNTYLAYTDENQVISDISWSPDGLRLMAAYDNTVRIYDASNLSVLQTIVHSEPVLNISWNYDGSQIAYIGSSSTSTIEIDSAPSLCEIDVADNAELLSGINTGVSDTICLENSTYTRDTVDNSNRSGANGLPVITGDNLFSNNLPDGIKG